MDGISFQEIRSALLGEAFHMSEQEYFKNAMSNFTFEVASGGAIRHLSDLGYTVSQIMKQLSFPTPYERVQKTVWEHLLDTRTVLLEEPGSKSKREKAAYVRDYDKYGKPSFRRVVMSADEEGGQVLSWKEFYFSESDKGSLAEFLKDKCGENGEEMSYFSCDFGRRLYNKDKAAGLMDALQALEEQHRDYILGLPWEKNTCYHRLDKRMREILVKLYEAGEYHGTCYFLKTGERMILQNIAEKRKNT